MPSPVRDHLIEHGTGRLRANNRSRASPTENPEQPFFPVIGQFRPVGRVEPMSLPGAELAVITHCGSHDDLDRSYGALATYVSEHALAVDGLIRECYLVGPHDTNDESAWRTEIGWPIFDTAAGGR
jgi:effector-binding domain-containing protein